MPANDQSSPTGRCDQSMMRNNVARRRAHALPASDIHDSSYRLPPDTACSEAAPAAARSPVVTSSASGFARELSAK